ncbi:MAG: class I SAM-dependent methyltransferase [Planctomycetes bacterium]|nr:class I SAM-dependent methyltransferase [Planctomycetota bacterium]
MTRDEETWQLVRAVDRMELVAPRSTGALRLSLSLRQGAMARRLAGARPSDALPRAIGLHRRAPPTVFDATAGLARDAMVLARLGCQVTAVERVPVLAFLVHEAARSASFAARLSVLVGDARDLLPKAAPPPQVVYLDPMFEHDSSAQVKQEMQVCRLLAGGADDAGELFAIARQIASQRVVVKRHARQDPLAEPRSFVIDGERVRFDVYLTAP